MKGRPRRRGDFQNEQAQQWHSSARLRPARHAIFPPLQYSAENFPGARRYSVISTACHSTMSRPGWGRNRNEIAAFPRIVAGAHFQPPACRWRQFGVARPFTKKIGRGGLQFADPAFR